MNQLSRRSIVVAAAAATLVASVGGLLTELGPWYHALRTPAWKPPDIAFGPIWMTIFTLTTVAALRGWRDAGDRVYRTQLLLLLALNSACNILWSVLFFRVQRPDWAFIEVWFLWGSIVALIAHFARRSAFAAALVVPYLLWVSTAALLNYTIVQLNGPFGSP